MSSVAAAVVVGGVALALGILVGMSVSGGGPARLGESLRRSLLRAIVPLAVIVVAVGAIAGLVYLASRDGDHDKLWSQVIAAASLLVVTIALFATGPKTEPDALPAGTDRVRAQRGLYFRALYVGADGRWSTSKLQALLWTFALLYAVLAIYIASELGVQTGDLKKGFDGLDFDEEYLLLLGGPYAAAVLAKGITSGKVADGAPKAPKAPDTTAVDAQPAVGEGLREVISDDDGRTDLADFQYFMFNLLALVVFFVTFVPRGDGLPDLPDFLVALTSAAALAYVGKKAVERRTPSIGIVIPSRVRHEEKIRIEGAHLVVAGEKPLMTIDGWDVEPTVESRPRDPEHSILTAVVPRGASPGPDKKVIVHPRGATVAAQATIEIAETTIASVDPSPLPWTTGTMVTIKGAGFGVKPGTATVAGKQLTPVDWSDTQVRATLPGDIGAFPPEGQQSVAVELPNGEQKTFPVQLAGLTMTPSAVEPSPLPLRPGAAVKITGTGFGTPPADRDQAGITLGTVNLSPASWSDQLIVATLPDDLTAVANRTGSDLALTVSRSGRAAQSLAIKVTLPAITVTAVTPNPVTVRAAERLFIVGTGFGASGDPAPPAVALGSMTLVVTDRSDTMLVVALPGDVTEFAAAMSDAAGTEQLIVRRTGWQEALFAQGVKRPEPVDPGPGGG